MDRDEAAIKLVELMLARVDSADGTPAERHRLATDAKGSILDLYYSAAEAVRQVSNDHFEAPSR